MNFGDLDSQALTTLIYEAPTILGAANIEQILAIPSAAFIGLNIQSMSALLMINQFRNYGLISGILEKTLGIINKNNLLELFKNALPPDAVGDVLLTPNLRSSIRNFKNLIGRDVYKDVVVRLIYDMLTTNYNILSMYNRFFQLELLKSIAIIDTKSLDGYAAVSSYGTLLLSDQIFLDSTSSNKNIFKCVLECTLAHEGAHVDYNSRENFYSKTAGFLNEFIKQIDDVKNSRQPTKNQLDSLKMEFFIDETEVLQEQINALEEQLKAPVNFDLTTYLNNSFKALIINEANSYIAEYNQYIDSFGFYEKDKPVDFVEKNMQSVESLVAEKTLSLDSDGHILVTENNLESISKITAGVYANSLVSDITKAVSTLENKFSGNMAGIIFTFSVNVIELLAQYDVKNYTFENLCLDVKLRLGNDNNLKSSTEGIQTLCLLDQGNIQTVYSSQVNSSNGFAGSQEVIQSTLASGISPMAQKYLDQGDTPKTDAANAALAQSAAMAASAQAGVDTDQAQFEGAHWASTTIKWSLADLEDLYANMYSDTLSTEEEAQAQEAFALWGEASGLTFVEVQDDAQADIVLGLTQMDTAHTGQIGYTELSTVGDAIHKANIYLEDTAELNLVADATGQLVYEGTQATFEQVLLHEIGHALGLNTNADASSVMYYMLNANNRALNGTDLQGIQAIYGNSASAQSAALLTQAMAAMATTPSGSSTGTYVTQSMANSPTPTVTFVQ